MESTYVILALAALCFALTPTGAIAMAAAFDLNLIK